MCCASFSAIPFISLYVHAKTSLNFFNDCSIFNTLFISSYALVFTMCGSASIPRLSFINFWSLVNVHPSICNSYALNLAGVSSTITFSGWWLKYISWYTLSSRATFDSYPLQDIFFYVLYILNSYFEMFVFTSISMISTSMVFTNWIVLGKLIVPIENNFGCVAKMISSSSYVIPF
jgi:hypothetical protein